METRAPCPTRRLVDISFYFEISVFMPCERPIMAFITFLVLGLALVQAQTDPCACDLFSTHQFNTLREGSCPVGAVGKTARKTCVFGSCSGSNLVTSTRTVGLQGKGPGVKTLAAQMSPTYRSQPACEAAGFVWTPAKCFADAVRLDRGVVSPPKTKCNTGTSMLVHAGQHGQHTCALSRDGVLDCWGGGDCVVACQGVLTEFFGITAVTAV